MAGRVLAVDPGTHRTGFALSDEDQVLARPLEIYTMKRTPADVQRVVTLCLEYEVVEVVFGVPYSLEGEITASTQRALTFSDEVEAQLPEGVSMNRRDEALTSWEAENRMTATGRSKKSLRKKLDAAAAAVLLQEVLDERSGGAV